MSTDNTLISKYLNRGVVQQRNGVTLVQWSGYVSTEPIPSPASDDWVRTRIVAETIPSTLNTVVQNTLSYFLQDSAVSNNVQPWISEDNDTAAEQTLATTNQSIAGAFIQRYANATVSDQQVSDWRTKNNSPAPPPANGKAKGK